MHLEHERSYGLDSTCLDMYAPVTVYTWNMNVIMVWAWKLCSFIPLEHARCGGWGMDAPVFGYTPNTNRALSWFGHERFGNRIHLEHERYHGLGMHALVAAHTWKVSMLWAWMRC